MNRTDPVARKINGIDPQHIIPKTLRDKIYASLHWQRDLTLADPIKIVQVIDKVQFIGVTSAPHGLPTAFIAFVLKLLQIGPADSIVLSYLRQEDLKYLRCVAALYIRLTVPAPEVYLIIEPLLADFRKIRVIQTAENSTNPYSISHIDEFAAKLLTNDRFYGLPLPHIQERHIFEENGVIPPRQSMLLVHGHFMTANLLQHIDTEIELGIANPFLAAEENRLQEQRQREIDAATEMWEDDMAQEGYS